MWYYTVVGQSRCPVVDTWWQTETGSHMIAPLPGAVPLKPGSCTLPLPGIMAAIVDEAGHEFQTARGGSLSSNGPFRHRHEPCGGTRTGFKNPISQRNWAGKYYLAGDSANRDLDGYFWIMGRSTTTECLRTPFG